jgi:PilZ domain
MSERRSLPRSLCYLGGVVEFNGRSTLNCVIRDISPLGARIVCPQHVVLPTNIVLVITKREQRLPARIVWHMGDQFGVSFITKEGGGDSEVRAPSSFPH